MGCESRLGGAEVLQWGILYQRTGLDTHLSIQSRSENTNIVKITLICENRLSVTMCGRFTIDTNQDNALNKYKLMNRSYKEYVESNDAKINKMERKQETKFIPV